VSDSPSAQLPAPTPESQGFVIDLDRDLRQGTLKIAGFPRITGEVLRQLGDDFGSSYQLARLISREPDLAARIIGMANSVAFRPAGRAPRELGAAIARLGHDTLRVVLFAFSLSVVRGLPEYVVVREPIARLWERSIRMSSLCRGLSANISDIPKDSVILAGLLHSMGKIFLLARAAWYAPILDDTLGLEHVLAGWHARVAESLLKDWDFDPAIITAVTRYDRIGSGDQPTRLTDMVALGDSLVDLSSAEGEADPWAAVLSQSPPARRLGFVQMDPAALRTLVAEESEQLMVVLN
jgi:HD-like signal output (HDOD) protein